MPRIVPWPGFEVVEGQIKLLNKIEPAARLDWRGECLRALHSSNELEFGKFHLILVCERRAEAKKRFGPAGLTRESVG